MAEEMNGSSNGDGAYKPRNILLTGGAGFIGSHVALRLIQRHPEYKVCSLSARGSAWCVLVQSTAQCAGLSSERAHMQHATRTTKKVVVYDSLEYCASMNNLSAVRNCPNFKVYF